MGRIVGMVLLYGLCSCTKPAEDVRLPLQLSAFVGPDGSGLAGGIDRQDAEEALAAAFARSELFRWSPDTGRGVELSYRLSRAGDGIEELIADLTLDAPGLARLVEEPELGAVVAIERGGPRSVGAEEDLALAVVRAAKIIETRIFLARREESAVRAVLRGDDPELLLLALEWLREHPDRRHVDEIAGLLGHFDDRVAGAAIDAIALVGGPEHVQAILRYVRLSDPSQAPRVYEALGAIGGASAEGFLNFAARNEEDPALRRIAERALDRLRNASTVTTSRSTPSIAGHRR